MRAALFALAALVASSHIAAGKAKQHRAEQPLPVSCSDVRMAVQYLGQAGAENYARSRGFTDAQIARARRECL